MVCHAAVARASRGPGEQLLATRTVGLAFGHTIKLNERETRMERFGRLQSDLAGDDVIAVGVQDTYVDSGIGVAQVSWSDPDDPEERRQSGLVQVDQTEELSLSKLLHRTLYVRRSDIQDAETRFDLE